MASYPYARVAHLTGLDLKAPYLQRPSWQKTDRTKTPTTLTGSPQALYSYALCIMFRDDAKGGYWVYANRSSPTTNRHIGAAQSVLSDNGYAATDELTDIKQGWDRYGTYRLWVKS